MSVRSVKVTWSTVNGAGAALANQQVTAQLIVPSGASPVDTNGDRIDLTPLTTTSDNTGLATFDPAATPTNGLIAPQDVDQYVSGSLVALAGCYWRISWGTTSLYSPNFAYTASTINAATWAAVPSTLGLIKCYLVDVFGSGAPVASRTFTVALSSNSFWTGGIGTGQRIPGGAAFPLVTDATGTISIYVIRQSELNPSTGAWEVTDTVDGGTVAFLAPATYSGTYLGVTYTDRGVYNAGTTYAQHDIVRRAADDEPFVSLTNSNTGNALTDGTHWADYAGVPIEAVMTTLAPPDAVALTASNIAAVENNPSGLHPSPATVQDVLDDAIYLAKHATVADATTTSPGLVEIHHAAGGAHPVAFTTDDANIANGVPQLDGSAHVPLAQLAGITHSQLDPSAGILAGQIASVNPATLTSAAFAGMEVLGTDLKATGLTGAATAVRVVGGNASGAPASGTFVAGDLAFDLTGKLWICTVGGTPGTWVQISGTGGGGGSSAFSWTTYTANHTVVPGTDTGILMDASAGGISAFLPSASGVTAPFTIRRKDSSVYMVRILPQAGQLINGQSYWVLSNAGSFISPGSDGSNWYG